MVDMRSTEDGGTSGSGWPSAGADVVQQKLRRLGKTTISHLLRSILANTKQAPTTLNHQLLIHNPSCIMINHYHSIIYQALTIPTTQPLNQPWLPMRSVPAWNHHGASLSRAATPERWGSKTRLFEMRMREWRPQQVDGASA